MGSVVRAASVLVGLGGLSFLIVAGTIAFGSFTYATKYGTFDCGSVIAPKDPTNRVARTAAIPPRLLAARNHCDDMRSSRAARFVVIMGSVSHSSSCSSPRRPSHDVPDAEEYGGDGARQRAEPNLCEREV